MRIFTGIFASILGFLLVVYRERVRNQIGYIGFAERYFGSGGTYTFILILGVLIFIGGLMWATGTLQTWFSENLGRFFGYS